jgi:hypothetical protein
MAVLRALASLSWLLVLAAGARAEPPRVVLGPETRVEGVLDSAITLELPRGHRIVGEGVIRADVVTHGTIEGAGRGIDLAGAVSGTGSFRGNVQISGTYSPGRSPAEVQFDNLTLAPTATFVIEIGGTTPGSEHDVIRVLGQAVLAGTLQAQLIDGFEPSEGDRFEFLTAAAISGAFGALDLPAGGVALGLDATPTSLALAAATAVPALWLAGAIALLSAMGAVGARRL